MGALGGLEKIRIRKRGRGPGTGPQKPAGPQKSRRPPKAHRPPKAPTGPRKPPGPRPFRWGPAPFGLWFQIFTSKCLLSCLVFCRNFVVDTLVYSIGV